MALDMEKPGACDAGPRKAVLADGSENTPIKGPKATGYAPQKRWHSRNPWAAVAQSAAMARHGSAIAAAASTPTTTQRGMGRRYVGGG